MKKVLFFYLFLLCINASFAQRDLTEDALTQAFLDSRDYQSAKSCIKVPGYDLEGLAVLGSYVKYVEDDRSKPVLYVMLGTGGAGNPNARLIGEFQVIKVSDNYRAVPNGGKFLISFRDYSNFNIYTKTGSIKYYDNNYDCYLAGEIIFRNGIVLVWNSYPMPEAIMEKYNFNNYNIDRYKAAHYCDGDKDKNVSWGECYRCMKNSCNGNPECKTLCDFADKNIFPVLKGQCKLSIAASCVILAAIY